MDKDEQDTREIVRVGYAPSRGFAGVWTISERAPFRLLSLIRPVCAAGPRHQSTILHSLCSVQVLTFRYILQRHERIHTEVTGLTGRDIRFGIETTSLLNNSYVLLPEAFTIDSYVHIQAHCLVPRATQLLFLLAVLYHQFN